MWEFKLFVIFITFITKTIKVMKSFKPSSKLNFLLTNGTPFE